MRYLSMNRLLKMQFDNLLFVTKFGIFSIWPKSLQCCLFLFFPNSFWQTQQPSESIACGRAEVSVVVICCNNGHLNALLLFIFLYLLPQVCLSFSLSF